MKNEQGQKFLAQQSIAIEDALYALINTIIVRFIGAYPNQKC